MVNCSAILLAAGKSTRMRCLKALLPWEGTTLLQHQISQFTLSSVDQLIIVLGYQSNKLLPLIEDSTAHIVWNEQYKKGKTESIKRGLLSVREQADCLIIASVDQPVNQFVINEMVRKLTETKRKIIIPVFQGKRGHPILFSTELLEELAEINEETQGLKAIVRKRESDIYELMVEDSSVLFNFNSLRDYEAGIYEGRSIK